MSVSLQPMNFRPKTYTFLPDCAICLLGEYPYEMTAPMTGDRITTADAITIFSQKLYLEDGFLCSETGKANVGNTVPLSDLAQLLDLEQSQVGEYQLLNRNGETMTEETIQFCLENRNQELGHLYRLFYYGPLDALIPVRFYIPKAVESGEKLPLMLLLHGGGSTVDEPFRESDNKIAELAEENGVLLMAMDGGVWNCSYGCKLMPEGIAKKAIPIFADNEKTLEGKRYTEDSVMQRIAYCCEKYPVDTDRIYVTGISMGGMGSFYLAQQHPDVFAACAPASAAPMADDFDTAPLTDFPIYFTAGTLDDHGFCHLERAGKIFSSKCKNMIFHPVEGGTHGHCWVDTMDCWFPFLLKQRRK